jgi:hypothetical protein
MHSGVLNESDVKRWRCGEQAMGWMIAGPIADQREMLRH